MNVGKVNDKVGSNSTGDKKKIIKILGEWYL